jgi:O-antigen ligase
MLGALVAYFGLSLISMATMSIGVALVAGTILYHHRTLRRLGWTREEKQLLLAGIALAAACVASLVAATLAPPYYGGYTTEVHWAAELPKFWYLLAPPFLSIALRSLNEGERSRLLRGWILAMGLLSIVCFVQFFTGWPRPQMIPGLEPYHHMMGFLGHHLSLASIWIFPVFAAFALFAESPGRRWFFGLCGLLGLLALVGTFSRTLWAVLPIGVWLLASFAGRRPGRFSLARAGVGLVVGAMALAALWQVPALQKRLNYSFGISDRTQLWEANWHFFQDRPAFGVGFRHNQDLAAYYLLEKLQAKDVFTGHAHNNLLEMLGSTGAVGTAAWFVWCALATLFFWRRMRAGSALGVGLFCAWVVLWRAVV